MKRLFLSSLAFGALALPAMAADMAPAPVYKAPVPVPVAICNWCGWYVGANAGYAWSNSNSVDTTTTNLSAIPGLNGDVGGAIAAQGTGSVSTKSNGFIGGGQFGYNWQAGNIVYGLETDIQGLAESNSGSSISNVSTVPGAAAVISSTGTITSSKSVSYLGTLRGRAGFLATPSFLVYGTGGLAYGGVKTSTTVTESLGFTDTPGFFGTSASATSTRVGWTAGAGIEWLFWSRWSAKIEYRYYDLGSVTNTLPSFQQFGGFGATLETVNASQSTTKFTGSDVSFGLNYHF
jgi:outer membrane immunogenic protein